MGHPILFLNFNPLASTTKCVLMKIGHEYCVFHYHVLLLGYPGHNQ